MGERWLFGRQPWPRHRLDAESRRPALAAPTSAGQGGHHDPVVSPIDAGDARALISLAATAGPELTVASVSRLGDQWTLRAPPSDGSPTEPAAAAALVEQLVRGACRHAVLIDVPRVEGCNRGRPILTAATIAGDLTNTQATHLSWAISGIAQLDPSLLARGLTGGVRRESIRSAQTLLRPWQSTPFESLPIPELLDEAARLAPGGPAGIVALFAGLFRRRILLAREVVPGVAAVPGPRRLQRILASDAGGAPDGYA